MQSLLLRLEADVAARGRRRRDIWPMARGAALVLLMLYTAFRFGALTSDSGVAIRPGETGDQASSAQAQVAALRGEIALQRAYIERLERIQANSARYGISTDLAAMIEDIALAESIDPDLAFQLVRVESEFNRRAVSSVGAIGYTQLMPATARFFVPGIRREELFDAETNLRIGFRFLRALLARYDGDMRLALIAYNRGPVTVDRLLAKGIDPANGYARLVLGR